MGELIQLVALLGLGSFSGVVVVVALILWNPDKVERWAELISVALSRVRHGFRRQSVKFGLQSSLNGFARRIADETGRRERTPIDVQWAATNETQSHFFADARLVLRLHPHERQDRNLVTASMIIVSETLVRRSKNFLSRKQSRSLDLYAVDHVLKESPYARALFREEVFGPEVDHDKDLAELVTKHQKIDQAQMFFPVLIRELDYLGQRVVVKPRDERLISDVSGLIDFLEVYADRIQGRPIPLNYQGRVLRCAIMIVAIRRKREAGLVGNYVHKLQELQQAGCDTVYLVGSPENDNKAFMTDIVKTFMQASGWAQVGRQEHVAQLRTDHSGIVAAPALLIVLRNPSVADLPYGETAHQWSQDLTETGAVEANGSISAE